MKLAPLLAIVLLIALAAAVPAGPSCSVARVTLELEAQADMSWVVIDDPIPGGAKVRRQAETIGWPVVFTVDRINDKALRKALDYAERELKIDRLLLRKELRAGAGKVFLDRYGQLIDLSASGQLASSSSRRCRLTSSAR